MFVGAFTSHFDTYKSIYKCKTLAQQIEHISSITKGKTANLCNQIWIDWATAAIVSTESIQTVFNSLFGTHTKTHKHKHCCWHLDSSMFISCQFNLTIWFNFVTENQVQMNWTFQQICFLIFRLIYRLQLFFFTVSVDFLEIAHTHTYTFGFKLLFWIALT